jgi:MFS family permease
MGPMEPHDGRRRWGTADPTRVAPPAAEPTVPMPAPNPAEPSAGSPDPGRRRDQGRGRYAEPRIQARDLGRTGIITPYARLARGQAFSVMGEALFAIGLAGTVFFSTDPNQSRAKVAGYLVLTFAPFVVAAPFIGPLIDRAAGGRRWVIFGAALVRALLCLALLRDLDDLLFYPEAFLMLVFSKVNLISKSALVPTTVRNDEELVEANSKLTSLGAISAVVGAALAGVATLLVKLPFLRLNGDHSATSAILLLAAVAFVLTAVQAWNLPPTRVAEHKADATERAELRGAGIFLAASATSLSRATMGFLTFLLAFWVKNEDHALAWIGVLVGAAQVGYFIGSVLAPRVRRLVSEERMIQYSLGATTVASAITFLLRDAGSGLAAASLLAFTVGLTSNVLKQGFDSLVQRDAPDANRGQSFAKFETRFQLWWAIGALIPVVIPIPLWVGIVVIALVSGFALASYLFGVYEMTEVVAGRRQPRERKPKPWSRDALRARRAARSADPGEGTNAPTEPTERWPTQAWPGDEPPGALTPPVAPVIGPDDPTLAGPGLLGQPDAAIPANLSAAPEGGLFDPGAPPPWPPPDATPTDLVELPGGGFALGDQAPPAAPPAAAPPATPSESPTALTFDTGAETDEWSTGEHDPADATGAGGADEPTTNELPAVSPPPLERF